MHSKLKLTNLNEWCKSNDLSSSRFEIITWRFDDENVSRVCIEAVHFGIFVDLERLGSIDIVRGVSIERYIVVRRRRRIVRRPKRAVQTCLRFVHDPHRLSRDDYVCAICLIAWIWWNALLLCLFDTWKMIISHLLWALSASKTVKNMTRCRRNLKEKFIVIFEWIFFALNLLYLNFQSFRFFEVKGLVEFYIYIWS